jgi:hypothetical protein
MVSGSRAGLPRAPSNRFETFRARILSDGGRRERTEIQKLRVVLRRVGKDGVKFLGGVLMLSLRS